MSRPLKFRVFDKATKRMSEPFHLFGETTCFNIIELWLMEYPGGKTTLERMGDIEEMQYTGLLDKKGVEICEGDIVLINNEKRAPVVFNNACFRTPYKDSHYRLGGWITSSIEVIGNIYQSPELT